MRQFLISLLLVCGIFTSVMAQDIVFSQFYHAPLQLNPGATGVTYQPRLTLNYRNQWPSFLQGYVTYAASYDQYFDRIRSGIGVSVMADIAGDGIYKTNYAGVTYSYNVQLGDEFFIKGGLEGGVYQANLDWNRLLFPDQIDPIDGPFPDNTSIASQEQQPANLTQYYPSVGAGILGYNKHFHGGFAIKHVNAPDESQLEFAGRLPATLPLRFTFHGGGEIPLDQSNIKSLNTFISPNFLFTHQGEFNQLTLGAYARMNVIFGGAWFRHTFGNSDAVIFLAGVQTGIFKVGYSYDLTISDLSAYSGGAHEVSLILNFDDNPKARKKRRSRMYNDCPKMFR